MKLNGRAGWKEGLYCSQLSLPSAPLAGPCSVPAAKAHAHFLCPPLPGGTHWRVPGDWQAPDQLSTRNGGEERTALFSPPLAHVWLCHGPLIYKWALILRPLWKPGRNSVWKPPCTPQPPFHTTYFPDASFSPLGEFVPLDMWGRPYSVNRTLSCLEILQIFLLIVCSIRHTFIYHPLPEIFSPHCLLEITSSRLR